MSILKIRDENGNVIEIPSLRGEKGEPGADGKDGADGKSAYAYAQEGGFEGTEEELAEQLANVGGSVGSNPNLLINGDFRNPVNQRGATSYSSVGKHWVKFYTLDRWFVYGDSNTITVTKNDDSVTISNNSSQGCYFAQYIEDGLKQNTYTLTVEVKSISGIVRAYAGEFSKGDGSASLLMNGTNIIHQEVNPTSVVIFLESGSSVTLEYIKLEQCSIATPFIPGLYEEELALCQRYYLPKTTYALAVHHTGGSLYGRIPLPCNMRTSPTIKSFIINSVRGDGKDITSSVTNVIMNGLSGNQLSLAFSGSFNTSTLTNYSVLVVGLELELDAEIY